MVATFWMQWYHGKPESRRDHPPQVLRNEFGMDMRVLRSWSCLVDKSCFYVDVQRNLSNPGDRSHLLLFAAVSLCWRSVLRWNEPVREDYCSCVLSVTFIYFGADTMKCSVGLVPRWCSARSSPPPTSGMISDWTNVQLCSILVRNHEACSPSCHHA